MCTSLWINLQKYTNCVMMKKSNKQILEILLQQWKKAEFINVN